MTPQTIEQAAIDYDMTIEEVKEVYANTEIEESFYDNLEAFIKRMEYLTNNGLID